MMMLLLLSLLSLLLSQSLLSLLSLLLLPLLLLLVLPGRLPRPRRAAAQAVDVSTISAVLGTALELLDNGDPAQCFGAVVDMGLGCLEEIEAALTTYGQVTGELGVDETEVAELARELDAAELLALGEAEREERRTRQRLNRLGMREELARSFQAHYREVHNLTLTLVEAAENPLNVSRWDVVTEVIALSPQCCSHLTGFLARGCLCDSGVSGAMLEFGWSLLNRDYRKRIINFAERECAVASQLELSDIELATRENLRQLDNQSAVCRCKKAKETGYDAARAIGDSMAFDSFEEAFMFFQADAVEDCDSLGDLGAPGPLGEGLDAARRAPGPGDQAEFTTVEVEEVRDLRPGEATLADFLSEHAPTEKEGVAAEPGADG